MSLWSGWAQNQPWYLLLFYASGVFCFGIVAAERIGVWHRYNTIFGKLRTDKFFALVGKADTKDELFVANCQVELQNRSAFDLYYQVDESELSLSGKVHPSPGQDRSMMLIQPGVSVQIAFASIAGLKAEPMSGRLKLRIKYGRTENNMMYNLHLEGEPQIAIATDPATGAIGGVMASLVVKKVEYT